MRRSDRASRQPASESLRASCLRAHLPVGYPPQLQEAGAVMPVLNSPERFRETDCLRYSTLLRPLEGIAAP